MSKAAKKVVEDVKMAFPGAEITVDVKSYADESLPDLWRELKEAERSFNLMRLQAEEEILRRYAQDIKPKGTSHVGYLKVVTGMTRKWDSDALEEIREKNPDKAFPFKTAYKEVAKGVEWTKENDPDFHILLVTNALTEKPKKASFSIDEKKLEEANGN